MPLQNGIEIVGLIWALFGSDNCNLDDVADDFFQGLVLSTGEEHYPLQTYIKQLIFQLDTSQMTAEQIKQMSMMSNTTLNAAKIFISMIPVLCIYPFLQKYFVTGITLGGVKE